jgi:hypothetical protein
MAREVADDVVAASASACTRLGVERWWEGGGGGREKQRVGERGRKGEGMGTEGNGQATGGKEQCRCGWDADTQMIATRSTERLTL